MSHLIHFFNISFISSASTPFEVKWCAASFTIRIRVFLNLIRKNVPSKNGEDKDGKYTFTLWNERITCMLYFRFTKRMHSPPFSFRIHANGTAVNPSRVHRSQLLSVYQFNWIHLQALKQEYICIQLRLFQLLRSLFEWQLRDISQWSMHCIRTRVSSSLIYLFLNSHPNSAICVNVAS